MTKAAELTSALGSTQVMKPAEPTQVILTFLTGERPRVELVGMWNGRMVKTAQNEIARAFRVWRHRASFGVQMNGGKSDATGNK